MKDSNLYRKLFGEARVSFGAFFLFMAFFGFVVWFGAKWGTEARMSNSLDRHYLGEVVNTPEMTLQVESVRRDSVGMPPLVPQAGDEFVIATISLRNNTNKQFDLIPLLYLYLKDEAGNVYNVVAVPSASSQMSGKILPHDRIREEIGFEVAKNAKGLRLYFDPGLAHNNVVAVDLKNAN